MTQYFTEMRVVTMAALTIESVRRMHCSSTMCGVAENWHIYKLLKSLYRFNYSNHKNNQIQNPVLSKDTPLSHNPQVADDILLEKFDKGVDPHNILTPDASKLSEPETTSSHTSLQLGDTEHSIGTTVLPRYRQKGNLSGLPYQ